MPNVSLPPEWPTYVCKGIWQGTSCKYLIQAPDAASAKERVWKQIARQEGGDTCLRVEILEERN